MYQPIRGQGGHLVFLIGPKTTNLAEDIEFLRHQILFSGVRDEVENVSSNGRPRRVVFVFLSAPPPPPKNKLVKDVVILLSFVSSVKFRSAVLEETKMSQPIRGQGRHLVFPIGPKKIHLVDGHPSCQVSSIFFFSSFREVKNVSDGRT